MKKVIISMLFIVCLGFSELFIISNNLENTVVLANSKGEKPPKDVCIEEYRKKWEEFDRKVLKDIVKGFNLDLSGYQEIIYDDLMLKVGENLNDHSDKLSLQSLFVGTSSGTRRLFLKNGLEGTEGYFLYKRTDGSNVIKKVTQDG
ncbi:hypothetical protein [Cytobacillus citreus]|uniref:hypothetical protein n=1 Tax=Cytobacillus citreus TaxID=2833586 RepID=UPI0020176A98|nr:hypothetical protein [Cytobacillus citreus]